MRSGYCFRWTVPNSPNTPQRSPGGPSRFRAPVPLGVRRTPSLTPCSAMLMPSGTQMCWSVEPSLTAGGEVSRCPVLGLVAHLSPAMRAAGGENASEWPGAVRQIWKSSLRLGISTPIPLQGLNGREVKRVSARGFSLEGQQDHLAAGSVPALVLAQDERHDPVPVVLVPPELPAERTRDEISDTEREPVDMHVSGRAALLILPEAGPERRQVPIGLAPILVQSRRLMRDQARGRECPKRQSAPGAFGRPPHPGAEPEPQGQWTRAGQGGGTARQRASPGHRVSGPTARAEHPSPPRGLRSGTGL